MRIEAEIRAKLNKYDVSPTESIGQHILIDTGIIDTIAGLVEQDSNVLEIGAGPGNLTVRIAEKAKKVVAVEIDRRFMPLLDDIQASYPNVNVVYKDAISLNFEKIVKAGFLQNNWQVVADLPFHISEPFIQKLIDIPIENAVLVVGDQLARKMQIGSPDNPEFSRLSLLTQTFFEPVVIATINRTSFYPQPRTDAALVVLSPREKREFERNTGLTILRNLFLTERKNPSVLSVIKDSKKTNGTSLLMSKVESHRYDRRQIRQELRQVVGRSQYNFSQPNFPKVYGSREVEKLGLPQDLLNKPFSRFDNQDIRTLTAAIRYSYGQ